MKTEKNLIESLVKKTTDSFDNNYGFENEKIVCITPASIILLGDHTHYNDGNIITCAIDRYVCISASKNNKESISVLTEKTELPVEIFPGKDEIDDLKFPMYRILQIVDFLNKEEKKVEGFNCSIITNIKAGIGLGRRAAFTVCIIKIINKLFNLNISEEEIINLAYRVEFNSIGKITNKALVIACLKNEENKILNYDFRSKEIVNYEFDNNKYSLLISDTKIDNFTNKLCPERITECEVGAKGLRLYIWGIKNLRDVKIDFLKKHIHMLPHRVYKRCFYNVTERHRVTSGIEELKSNNFENFGKLLTESHKSLAEDYEVSTEIYDHLVNEAKQIEGFLGSKLISCSPKHMTIHIIENKYFEEATNNLKKSYSDKFGKDLECTKMNICEGYFEYSESI